MLWMCMACQNLLTIERRILCSLLEHVLCIMCLMNKCLAAMSLWILVSLPGLWQMEWPAWPHEHPEPTPVHPVGAQEHWPFAAEPLVEHPLYQQVSGEKERWLKGHRFVFLCLYWMWLGRPYLGRCGSWIMGVVGTHFASFAYQSHLFMGSFRQIVNVGVAPAIAVMALVLLFLGWEMWEGFSASFVSQS